MNYYHCSPTPGLTLLEPRPPEFNNKPQAVYLAELFPMALLYGIHNFEYAYGFTKEKALYYSEYFPDALKTLYAGKSASVYLCAPGETQGTRIPFEALSFTPVKVLEEIQVPDLYEALLEQERLGTIAIHRYADHSQAHLNWIRQAELNEIKEYDLLAKGGPRADYIRTHYPKAWEEALQNEKAAQAGE